MIVTNPDLDCFDNFVSESDKNSTRDKTGQRVADRSCL